MIDESHSSCSVQFWHHRDLLFHVAARVDDNSLRKLLYPELWDVLKSLLSDDRFWYERTMYLVEKPLQERLDASWKRICLCTLPGLDLSGPLSYLPAALVHIELGRPIPDTNDTWRDVSSPNVLRHLLSIGTLTTTTIGARECLNSAVARPSLDMIDLFMTMFSSVETEAATDQLLHTVITYGIRESMQHVLDTYEYTQDRIESAIRLAATRDRAAVLIPLLDHHQVRMDETAMDIAITNGSATVVELLFPRVQLEIGWDGVLRTAIVREHTDLVRYTLTHIHPTLDHLRLALQKGTLATTQAVLSDPRLNPSIDLADTLAYVCRSQSDVATVRVNVSLSPVVARAGATDILKVVTLARHKLVRVEKLDTPSLRLLLHCLGPTLLDRVKGYMLAESLSRVRSREQLGRAFERSDPYALTLRFVLVRQPRAVEILDWMCETGEEGFRLASSSVVNDKLSVMTELIPIRALMVCLLYPSLTLHGLLDWLREQGVSGEPLVRSARLVGLYYGQTQLTSQLRGEREA